MLRSLASRGSRSLQAPLAAYSTASGAHEVVDVAIVGAGMVGAAVAALLREFGGGVAVARCERACCRPAQRRELATKALWLLSASHISTPSLQ